MNPSICIRFHSPLTKYCVIILKNRNSRKSSNSRKREVPVTKICANPDYCMLCYSKSEIFRFRASFLTEYFNFNRWSIFQASHLKVAGGKIRYLFANNNVDLQRRFSLNLSIRMCWMKVDASINHIIFFVSSWFPGFLRFTEILN